MTGSGKINSEGKTILYSGHELYHSYGVGIVTSQEATKSLIGWKPVNERIITARFQTKFNKLTLIQVYAPVEDAEEEEKDSFYEQLQDVVNETPRHDILMVCGDMNAQMDQNRTGMEGIKGPHNTGRRTTENGNSVQMFCNTNGLVNSNSFFAHKEIHKKTWRSPDGKHQNEIDYIFINRRWKSTIHDVRACRGADIGSDHYLLRASCKIKLKRIQKKPTIKPLAVEHLRDPTISQSFKLNLNNRFSALEEDGDIEEQWQRFSSTVVKCAEEVIGRRRGTKREKWIRSDTWKLIDDRKRIKQKRDHAKSEQERRNADEQYRAADRMVKRSCKMDKTIWMEAKCQEAQEAANKNDSKALYRIVRDLTGSKNNNVSLPVKSKQGKLLLTEKEQNDRWVEHFRETLNQPTPQHIINPMELQANDQLRVDLGPITEDEVRRAIKSLKNNKAPGIDQISAEILKQQSQEMQKKLTHLLNNCWMMEDVPLDWRRGAIVKLPKKGNLTECGNWRGITLLSIPGKVLCAILLNRLRDAVDTTLREEQAGFRKGRSTCEQIFVLRNIIEQSLEYQQSLNINFIDFTKAFDSVHRETLWNIARHYGIPEKFINLFKKIYEDSCCCIKTETGNTEFFNIVTGVRQGCLLSPMMFLLVVDFVMCRAVEETRVGIAWKNYQHLSELAFADDIALLAENVTDLQALTSALEKWAARIGLRISTSKTKSMAVGRPQDIQIAVNDESVEAVDDFPYLGSVISADGDVEKDVNCRIGKASAVFQRMQPIWSSKNINMRIKLQLFKTVVVPVAVYASETWKMTAKIAQKLNVFQQRCLRKILKVTYLDRVRNETILERTKCKCLADLVAERRLRFMGHILRLPEERPASACLDWTPPGGKRKRGRPKKTWKSTVKDDLRRLETSWEEAKQIAGNRQRWRSLAAQCTTSYRRN